MLHALARSNTSRPCGSGNGISTRSSARPYAVNSRADRSTYGTDTVFEKAGIVHNIRIFTPVAELAFALVAAGIGVSIVSNRRARLRIRFNVAIRPFSPRIDFPIYASRPLDRSRSILVDEFIETVQHQLL